MAGSIKSIAVVGAGPGGAIATDALVKEQAFDTIRVFERQPAIGGAWIYTPHLPAGIPSLKDLIEGNADRPVDIPTQLPTLTPKSEAINSHQVRFSDTPQHECLHSNTDLEILAFTQYPISGTVSKWLVAKYGPKAPYRERETLREYVEGIFVRNGYDKLVELNTTVERAEKREHKWVLTLRREGPSKNHWWQESFDALVVASGHYYIPWIPDIPGLLDYDAKFPGRVLHAKHFRDAKKFKGKRVIVVGGSVSAAEIIHEILPYAKHPVIGSLRGAPIPAFGLIPWTHPHIAIKKQITKFDSGTGRIFFEDGSHFDDIDHVIFGTGYTFSLPYLPSLHEEIKRANRRLPGVYQHTWSIKDPSIAFIGMMGGGFTFRVFEWQAVAIARHFAGRGKTLPPVEEQEEWERERVARLKGGKAYYSIGPDFEEFFEFLRDIAGDPVPGTTGLSLPPFQRRWLGLFTAMVIPKLTAWENSRKDTEDRLEEHKRTKL